jgi:hypothetical protein
VQRTGTRPKIVVSADGRGVVGHVGARLLTDLADATGLSESVSDALLSLRQRASGHSPGRIAVDVAVMLADGGQAIADLAVLRGQSMPSRHPRPTSPTKNKKPSPDALPNQRG